MNIVQVTKTFNVLELMPDIKSTTAAEWLENVKQAVVMHTLIKDDARVEERVAELLTYLRGY